jgi:hypothetical protein
MPTSRHRPGDGTRTVSDIEISRVYQVVCDEHGVITEDGSYAVAVRARRAHFNARHQTRRER